MPHNGQIVEIDREYARETEDLVRAMFFESKCYEVDIRLPENSSVSHALVAKLDTGVGPSLIRNDAIPVALRSKIWQFRTSLRSAGNATFQVDGVIRLTILFGECEIPVLFGEAPTLATKVILGTTFFNESVKTIRTEKCLVITKEGSSVPILTSYSVNEVQIVEAINREEAEHPIPCYVATMMTIPPRSQSLVMIKTEATGLLVIEPML